MCNTLVIDDDKEVREQISEILTNSGNRCAVAADGKEGMELFDSRKWDLVLLDSILPKVSGHELLEYIKPSKTAVVILSPLNQLSARIQWIKMGADDYLSKPINIGELLVRIETVIKKF